MLKIKFLRSIILFFNFIALSVAWSDHPSYTFYLDRHFSPGVGSQNLLSLHAAVEGLTDFPLITEEDGILPALGRAAELLAFWYPLNVLTMTVQHEVFGHGYRVRDLGELVATVKKYSFRLPYPLGSGVGSTQMQWKKMPKPHEEIAVMAGGIEATRQLSHSIRMGWMQQGSVDPKEASLYTLAHEDLIKYVHSLRTSADLFLGNYGHDIAGYLSRINEVYPSSHLSLKKLKYMTLLELLDPFTYYAIYSQYRYILFHETVKLPTFLTMPCLQLTPFGPLIQVSSYMLLRDKPVYVYFSKGKHASNHYFGLGAYCEDIASYKNHRFGMRFDLWQQPKIISFDTWTRLFEMYRHDRFLQQFPDYEDYPPLPKDYDRALHTMQIGGALTAIYTHNFVPDTLRLYVELGVKTQGYLAGESLYTCLISKIHIHSRF